MKGDPNRKRSLGLLQLIESTVCGN